MERLAVWMYGHQIATLSRQDIRLGLEYTEQALDQYDANTPLLSVSMPLRPLVYGHHIARPYFDGLLPEGEARRMLAHDFRLADDDTFGLLAVLGRDCAGALIIVPEGTPLTNPADVVHQPLTEEAVIERLQNLSVEPLGVDDQVRVSLAGVQQKMVLTRLPDGSWTLPIRGLPSTHILKRAETRWPHMIENEALCLAVGRHLGIETAQAEIMDASESILVVERYDRRRGDHGTIDRIHQEDMCQALSVASGAKYEEHGGPNLRTISRLLRDWTPGSTSRERLLDITVLNMAVGNGDAHAKNLSLLHSVAAGARLAPAYDVVSTTYYPKADKRPGMSVNKKSSIDAVSADDIIAEATSWGLPARRVVNRVHDLVIRLPRAIEAAAIEVPRAPGSLVQMLQERARRFLEGVAPQPE